MRKPFGLAMAMLFASTLAFAADQTWTGTISDSDCGRSHKSAIEHAGKKLTDHDCVVACVKDHGAKYVFVSGSKVYNISNQDFAGLEEHAGHALKVSGSMSGDTITVSKIEMSGSKM
ncbi:MAG TPA: hypothetical protein VJA66_18370 [Thermoanaerobaculia bacterium]